jgi:hypothetical protein
VRDWDSESARLAARALAAGRPTVWFEELYAASARDEITMPWDRARPSALLADWLTESGAGRSAGGGGLWADAEFVAVHGFCGDGGPPWAFTRAEIASFAGHGLETVTIERLDDGTPRWRAEFTRLEGRASSR